MLFNLPKFAYSQDIAKIDFSKYFTVKMEKTEQGLYELTLPSLDD